MSEEEILMNRQKRMQEDKLERFRILNGMAKKGEILFTGSSLMEQFPVNELLMARGLPYIIYNRGIGGFTTDDMLEHMEEMVFGTKPSKIFINIGTNDIAAEGFSSARLIRNYEKILKLIQNRLPGVKIYVMAYYPVNEAEKMPDSEWRKAAFANRNNFTISKVNAEIKKLAEKSGCSFIDVNNGLTDQYGRLKKEYTVEGIHMYANAYQIILDNMMVYLD